MSIDIGVFCQPFSPTEVPEHEHQEWQISILSPIANTQVSWHTATGRQQQKRFSGEQIVITPTGQPHGCHFCLNSEFRIPNSQPTHSQAANRIAKITREIPKTTINP